MKKILYYLGIVILLIGCKSEKNKLQTKIPIDNLEIIDMPDEYRYTSNIDEVIAQIEFIPLETSKECHLVNPRKVIFNNMNYYVLDFRRGLYVFDLYGNFSHKIGKIGRGPSEIIEINDFDFDNQGNILILDAKRIQRYAPDGKFMDTYQKFDYMNNGLYCNPYQFVFIERSKYYIWGGTLGVKEKRNNHFAMYKMAGKEFMKGFFPLKHKLSDKQHRFLRCDSEILVNPVIGNDTIYSINRDSVYAKYFINFKYGVDSKSIPNKLNSLSEFGYDLLNNNRISYNIINPLETEHWLSFTFTHQKSRIIAFYNKNKKNVYTIRGGISSNGDASNMLLPYWFHFMHDDSFCSITSAREFLLIKENIKNTKCPVEFLNINHKVVKNDDNHVIIKFKAK